MLSLWRKDFRYAEIKDHHTQTSRPVSQSSITASPAGTATSAYVSISCCEKAKCELDSVDWYVYYTLCHEIGLQSVSNSLATTGC